MELLKGVHKAEGAGMYECPWCEGIIRLTRQELEEVGKCKGFKCPQCGESCSISDGAAMKMLEKFD